MRQVWADLVQRMKRGGPFTIYIANFAGDRMENVSFVAAVSKFPVEDTFDTKFPPGN
jgi:hypothetical protein